MHPLCKADYNMMCYETAISHMPILGLHPRLRIRAPPGFNTQGMECRVLYPGDPSDSTFKGQEPTDGTPNLRVKCHLSPGKKADHHTETSQINIPFQILGGFNWPCSSGVGFWGESEHHRTESLSWSEEGKDCDHRQKHQERLGVTKAQWFKKIQHEPTFPNQWL